MFVHELMWIENDLKSLGFKYRFLEILQDLQLQISSSTNDENNYLDFFLTLMGTNICDVSILFCIQRNTLSCLQTACLSTSPPNNWMQPRVNACPPTTPRSHSTKKTIFFGGERSKEREQNERTNPGAAGQPESLHLCLSFPWTCRLSRRRISLHRG